MPPIFDFSSAYSWVLAGFIAGLLLFWLIRRLMGIDARRLQEIADLNASLDDAKRSHSSLAGSNAQLESERARLVSEINQLSPRASLVPQYERQVAELKQASATAQSVLDASKQEIEALRQQMAAEIASLRQDADVKASTAKYYEDEYGRLHSAHQALNNDWTSASGLVSKLQSDYAVASREAQEATRLRSEMSSARAEIDSLRADLANASALARSDAAKLAQDADAKVQAAKQTIAARDGDIARLTAEVARLGEEGARLKTAAGESANLSSEVNRLNAEVGQLRAAESARAALADEVARLKASLAAAPKDLSGEVARLTSALAAAPKEDLSGEVARLQSQLAGLRNADTARAELADEVARLKSALAAAPKEDLGDDVARLNGDVARLSASLDSMRSQERSTAMELHAARTDLSQVRTALEETTRLLGERHSEVEQLRARLAAMPDVESYRRFKDALDAANRIAAGLPEKS